MNLRERLPKLARVSGDSGRPMVSVYLNMQSTDEHHRDRALTFLKNELRKAREADRDAALAGDLAWIEITAKTLLRETDNDGVRGIALFSGGKPALREVLTVAAPLDDGFFVAARPVLAPLAALVDDARSALVVFADGVSARFIPVAADRLLSPWPLSPDLECERQRARYCQPWRTSCGASSSRNGPEEQSRGTARTDDVWEGRDEPVD